MINLKGGGGGSCATDNKEKFFLNSCIQYPGYQTLPESGTQGMYSIERKLFEENTFALLLGKISPGFRKAMKTDRKMRSSCKDELQKSQGVYANGSISHQKLSRTNENGDTSILVDTSIVNKKHFLDHTLPIHTLYP